MGAALGRRAAHETNRPITRNATAHAIAHAHANATAPAIAIAHAIAYAIAYADAIAIAFALRSRPMITLRTTLRFTTPGYIEHPYWPEMYRLIEIDKRSGVNRARTEANRRRALQAYLEGEGLTLDDYEQLRARAQRPFHANASGIYIPREKVLACLVNAADVAPARHRIPNLRTAVSATDFQTDRTAPDGVWERFAVVTLGTGAKASNQRGLRSNAYLASFDAVGTLAVEADMVDPSALVALLEFAGRSVGIGASRSMGWGRFEATVQPMAAAA